MGANLQKVAIQMKKKIKLLENNTNAQKTSECFDKKKTRTFKVNRNISNNLTELVCQGKNVSLDMNTLMAREGRTVLTRTLDYKPSRNRPNTSLVRLYAILVPSTEDLNAFSRGHHVAR